MSGHPKDYCPVFGNYPKEYNRAVHGPYYPWVNYGPKDVSIGEVKLGEFKNWFGRRNKTPAAFMAAFSRQYYNWHHRWMETKFGSPSKPLFQIMILMSVANLLVSYGYYRNHRMHKYHW